MKLPTLFKKTSKGKTQVWNVETQPDENSFVIITSYGEKSGKIQTTKDIISSGKNIGKANETSVQQQAEFEAKAQWTYQQERKGYVQDESLIGIDQRDGVEPMLAHRFDQHGDKMIFPCFVQPKLDGHRCIAVIDKKCELFTRTRNLITGVPHINKALEKMFSNQSIVLDGELYNHSYKHKFEELTSFIRSEDPKEGHEIVQYHVYDVIDTSLTTKDRMEFITKQKDSQYIKFLETSIIEENQISPQFKQFLKAGFEGAMLRNPQTKYEQKRSYGLLKVKEFEDSEFLITGIKEGRGKLAGHAIFTCKTKDDVEFDVKLKGEMDYLKEIFNNPTDFINKMLSVQYQGLTKNNLPRFPVGLRIREDI